MINSFVKYSQFGKHGQLTFISLSSDITFHNLKIKKEIKKKKRIIFQIITRSKIFIQLTRWIFDFVSFSFFFFWMTLNQCTSFRLIDFVSFGHFVTFLHYRRIWDRILRITFPVTVSNFTLFKYSNIISRSSQKRFDRRLRLITVHSVSSLKSAPAQFNRV